MKLVTFKTDDGGSRIGVIQPERNGIIDLQRGADGTFGAERPHFANMLALIDAGLQGLDEAARIVRWVEERRPAGVWIDTSSVTLLAPVPVPRRVRDCLVFEKHFRQAREQALKIRAATFPDPVAAAEELRKTGDFSIPPVWYEQPIYYKGNPFSVIGTDADVIWPAYSEFLDYELEFGIFIGRGGKNIPPEKAREYIYGYAIFNDFSARDAQYREMAARLGPAKGKDFDTGNAIGPWLVTADEVTNPYDLTMIARVNGEEWSRGNSGDMYHKFDAIVAYASREESVYSGEFIGSGTVGNGCCIELGKRLSPGDVIELEITGLGILRNRLVKLV